ncbi:MAG: PRC-barrel domain-containing protein [Terriglobia bacterium]
MAQVEPKRLTRHVLSASTLTGNRVINRQGEDLGKIEDLMIDLDRGRIAYAVLSFGGILGLGDKLFAIPWEALSLDPVEERFTLGISKDLLDKAPGFNKDNWPDMADPAWGAHLYGYYGYKPYWS